MKVIKRDGRAVDYNREKIAIAIQKANEEVKPRERLSKEEIKEITKYIEELDKKRILVEDIQDIIEQQLMDRKKFELAKKYSTDDSASFINGVLAKVIVDNGVK